VVIKPASLVVASLGKALKWDASTIKWLESRQSGSSWQLDLKNAKGLSRVS